MVYFDTNRLYIKS